jgi:amphi-Trp domain-containing protein
MKDKHPREVELVHEAMHEPAQLAHYFRAIADGLESGHLRLRSGDHEVELRPASLCTFELRSVSERERVKLQVQLGWREAASGGDSLRFEIGSD